MKLLLDTNVISDFVRGEVAVQARLRACSPSDVAVSSITVMEIAYGLERNPGRARKIGPLIDSILRSVTVLEYSEADARESGRVRAELEALGRPIGLCDAMLAGSALSRDLRIVTHNTGELERVNGLRVEDWRAAN